MSRAFGAALLALLLLPVVSAQFEKPVPPRGESSPGGYERGFFGFGVSLRIESAGKEEAPIDPPWLLLGADNLLNLSFYNFKEEPVEATFELTASGAAISPRVVTLRAEPGASGGALVTVHADDAARVIVSAIATDLFQPGGEPARADFDAIAISMPSIRMVDPARPVPDDESEFQSVMGPVSGSVPYARVRSGESLRVRIEARNPLAVATAGFRATLETNGAGNFEVDVPTLEPGEVKTLEFPEFTPQPSSGFPGQSFGPGPMYQSWIVATVSVAGLEARVRLAEYTLENGAVKDAFPAGLWIQVQDGIAIDVSTPKRPTLGVPSRVKFNITNNGLGVERGTVTLSIQTPGGLYYEVQGPEAHSVDVNLAPGQTASGAVEFSPRVTGAWSVFTTYQSSGGFSWGGGGGVIPVAGPVTISLDEVGVAYVRINEAVRIGVTIATTKTLQDAQMRVTSGSQGYFDTSRATSGEFTPGLQQRLLSARTDSASLGALRPGGAVNATIEVSSRSSGRYDVVPYVLAEGFAFTSSSFDGQQPYSLAVQARPVATAWAIMPFMVALGVFVGTWTLRTRFVK